MPSANLVTALARPKVFVLHGELLAAERALFFPGVRHERTLSPPTQYITSGHSDLPQTMDQALSEGVLAGQGQVTVARKGVVCHTLSFDFGTQNTCYVQSPHANKGWIVFRTIFEEELARLTREKFTF